MEFEVPEWLTKQYLQNALENGKSYKASIEDLKIDMPIAKGTNYTSDIYKIDIKYKKSNNLNNLFSKSLIIKSPKKGPMYDSMVKVGFLQKEPNVYEQFSPKLKSIFSENSQEDTDETDDHLLAEYFISTEEGVLILEDLKSKGYKMADRLQRLDYDHCVVALKGLAKFHAGSVLIHEKEPQLIENLGREITFRDDSEEIGRSFVVNAFKAFPDVIKNYPNLVKYSNWFKENAENIFQFLIDAVKRKENEFNVLNHGDFWVSNMLFKYNENNIPIKVIPIDLQISRYTSPVIDFIYFIDGSVQESVRKEKLDALINIYLNELNSILEKFDCPKRLERSEFDKSFKERYRFVFFVLLILVPFCVADADSTEIMDLKVMNLDDTTDKTSPVEPYYKSKNFIKILSARLEELEKLGLITAN